MNGAEAMSGGDKKLVFEEMLEAGMVMLHLDARRPGVEAPPHLQGEHHLRLNFSYRFHLEHFDIGDDAVEASLSFGGVPHLCIVPWTAVFAMTSHASGEWRIWGEDLPEEVLERAAALTEAETGEPMLADDLLDDDEDLEPGGAVRRVGHLRVIK